MAIEEPHLEWPFRMGGANESSMNFVEQDSPAEVAQCVAFVVSTEPGTLVPAPELGLQDPTFKQGGMTESEIINAISRWEPRALIVFTEDELLQHVQTIGIEVT